MNTALASSASQRSPAALHAQTGGAGETVICLHSSAGSHAQWRALSGELEGRCRLVVPDLHGHGRSPAWPLGTASTLQVDAHAASQLIPASDTGNGPRGVHLVGHSYGAAVAVQMALRCPRRVLSLTLYEPLPFGMLLASAPDAPASREIKDIRHSVASLVREGELEAAARLFVVYWGGASAWDGMSAAQRVGVLLRIGTVPCHFEALFQACWTVDLLRCLTMPVLLLQGSDTRAPARAATDALAAALGHCEQMEIAGAGHLGPLTHPDAVNAAIVLHLWRQWAFRGPRRVPAPMAASVEESGHVHAAMP